jgi:hypothetical protein
MKAANDASCYLMKPRVASSLSSPVFSSNLDAQLPMKIFGLLRVKASRNSSTCANRIACARPRPALEKLIAALPACQRRAGSAAATPTFRPPGMLKLYSGVQKIIPSAAWTPSASVLTGEGNLHTASGQRGERDQRHALRKTGLQFHPRHRASCCITSIPIVLVVNPSFRVRTAPELIACQSQSGQDHQGRPSAFVPPSRPPNSRISSSATTSSSRCGAEQRKALKKNAARFKREIEFDRRPPANSLNKSSTQLWLTLGP